MSIKTICAGIGVLALIGGLAACGSNSAAAPSSPATPATSAPAAVPASSARVTAASILAADGYSPAGTLHHQRLVGPDGPARHTRKHRNRCGYRCHLHRPG